MEVVRWDKGGNEAVDNYIFFYGKGNANNPSGRDLYIRQSIRQLGRNRLLLILRGR
jgi:hypothetical protein